MCMSRVSLCYLTQYLLSDLYKICPLLTSEHLPNLVEVGQFHWFTMQVDHVGALVKKFGIYLLRSHGYLSSTLCVCRAMA